MGGLRRQLRQRAKRIASHASTAQLSQRASVDLAFRRHGFPIERAGTIQQLTITRAGVQAVAQERWEYRTKDEHIVL